MKISNFHQSVLPKEVIDLLKIKEKEKYIDATLGGGGHTLGILNHGGIVLGIDQDQEALDHVASNLESWIKNSKLFLKKGNFKDIDKIANENGFGKVSGVLFDLGISSYQIDTPERGFSFLRDGPLDMRMDKDSNLTAEVLINLLQKGELDEIFKKYGQEYRSRVISNSIVRARRIKAIKTTSELAEIVARAYGIRGEVSDFTKNLTSQKVFQALRIAVNSELESLKEALPRAVSLLDKNGRLLVISFHSLEDKIVKDMFIDFEDNNLGKIITKKPIIANVSEVKVNSRSKSAKLRIFAKN